MQQNIRTDPLLFREAFLAEVSPGSLDTEYGAVVRVILYYLWRGCATSLDAGLSGKSDPKASLIAQSSYESTFAIIQLLRIGYHVDAATLLRSQMERIAIVGYLAEKRDLIPLYFKGEVRLNKAALDWAKKNSLPNWMLLWGLLSGLAHSSDVAAAGHINSRTKVAQAFNFKTSYRSGNQGSLVEEFLGLIVYALLALDPLALKLIQNSSLTPFSRDSDLVTVVGREDAMAFTNFLKALVERYQKRAE
jgi:hypothetical protein